MDKRFHGSKNSSLIAGIARDESGLEAFIDDIKENVVDVMMSKINSLAGEFTATAISSMAGPLGWIKHLVAIFKKTDWVFKKLSIVVKSMNIPIEDEEKEEDKDKTDKDEVEKEKPSGMTVSNNEKTGAVSSTQVKESTARLQFLIESDTRAKRKGERSHSTRGACSLSFIVEDSRTSARKNKNLKNSRNLNWLLD